MPFRPASLRLPAFDYRTAGAYFVTACTKGRAPVFGRVRGGEVRLSPAGEIALRAWHDLPAHYRHVRLDAFVVMPDHVHGVLWITDPFDAFVGAGLKPAPTPAEVITGPDEVITGPDEGTTGPDEGTTGDRARVHSLSEIVRGFKTFSARRINDARGTPGRPVWQRGFYEHVVRGEADAGRIRRYVAENPARWEQKGRGGTQAGDVLHPFTLPSMMPSM